MALPFFLSSLKNPLELLLPPAVPLVVVVLGVAVGVVLSISEKLRFLQRELYFQGAKYLLLVNKRRHARGISVMNNQSSRWKQPSKQRN